MTGWDHTILCIENVWAFKFPFWVNERPQIEHTKGLDPVCIRSCILRCEDFESLNHTYSWHDRVRSHYIMHRKCMSFQVPLLSKRAPTYWTHERPRSRMYAFMHLEMWRSCKKFATFGAGILKWSTLVYHRMHFWQFVLTISTRWRIHEVHIWDWKIAKAFQWKSLTTVKPVLSGHSNRTPKICF